MSRIITTAALQGRSLTQLQALFKSSKKSWYAAKAALRRGVARWQVWSLSASP